MISDGTLIFTHALRSTSLKYVLDKISCLAVLINCRKHVDSDLILNEITVFSEVGGNACGDKLICQ